MNVTAQSTVRRIGNFLFAALTCIFLAPEITSAQARVVTVSTGEWGPYVSETLPEYGISPHIISAAFSKVGIRVEYQFFPWPRAMKEAEEHRADLTGIWYSNGERKARFHYSDSVISAANIFFHLKDRPFDWNNFEGFPDKTIGITRGYSYSADFDEAAATDKVRTEVTGSDTLNFRKLLRGRIDAFVMAELAGYELLKNEFNPYDIARIKAHPTKVSSAPLHLLSAKGNQRGKYFLEQFNKGIEILKTSGELDQILQQYR